MPENWNDEQPIYRQLRDRVSGLIMDGTFSEGEAVPSVRTVAAEQQINHLTVAKAYQELVDIGVLEMKRGRGMFVLSGARQTLFDLERQKFEVNEVPAIVARLEMLGISIDQFISLLKAAK
ncbi:GntR family transcriptional regulator [Arenicella xantha]|uniref:GntR family transcriptional regulator n=1 Tax=Arenicella xantha TaxID=644221 RepID=A0A395JNC5_9GAMM|nr:GntR family transcriptional regulator [Arenicella xantha]RBP52793.1 GntR family transcriptional regulator [Arenicella xantha]